MLEAQAAVNTVVGGNVTDCWPFTVREVVGAVGVVDVADTTTLAVVVAEEPVWNDAVNVPAYVYVCGVENGGGITAGHVVPAPPPCDAGVPSPHIIVYGLHAVPSWNVAVTVRGAIPDVGATTNEYSVGFGAMVTVLELNEPLDAVHVSVYEVRLPDIVPVVELPTLGATDIETGSAPPIVYLSVHDATFELDHATVKGSPAPSKTDSCPLTVRVTVGELVSCAISSCNCRMRSSRASISAETDALGVGGV